MRILFIHFVSLLLLFHSSHGGGFICTTNDSTTGICRNPSVRFPNTKISSSKRQHNYHIRQLTSNQNFGRIRKHTLRSFLFASIPAAFAHEQQQHYITTTAGATNYDPFSILISDATTATMTMTDNDSIGMLSKEMTVIVFIIGVIPFIIATYEFWRRIAVGATFGTGNDSVVFPTTTSITTTTTIGEDNAPNSSRGKQILGQDSLITAYLIFTTVAIVLGIVLYSVVTSPIPAST